MNDAASPTFEDQKRRAIEIGVATQMRLADEVAAIRLAVQAGNKLQSWPVALGSPDAQQYRYGAECFGGRWYMTNDPQCQAILRAGALALDRLQGAIHRQCRLEGIETDFSSSSGETQITIPDPSAGIDTEIDRPRARATHYI